MSRTKILLIFSSILAVFLLGVLVFGIFFIRNQNKQISTLTNAADTAEGKDTLAQTIRSIQNSSKDDVTALNNLVLTDSRLVPFIELIESLGKSMGLKTSITSVSVDKIDDVNNSTKPNKIHVIIDTEGPWSSSIGFIYALENLPSHNSIDSSTVSGSNKDWHTSSNITIYSFK